MSAGFRVDFEPAAVRQLRRLDRAAQRRVIAAIELLADDPHPPGATAMAGQPRGTFRVRTGDYRIIYEIDDGTLRVLVVRVGHRRDVYRRL